MPDEDHRRLFPEHRKNNDANTRALEEVAEGIADVNETLHLVLLGRKKKSLNGYIAVVYGEVN